MMVQMLTFGSPRSFSYNGIFLWNVKMLIILYILVIYTVYIFYYIYDYCILIYMKKYAAEILK